MVKKKAAAAAVDESKKSNLKMPKEEQNGYKNDKNENESDLTEVEQAIADLREKAKEDPDIDYRAELRKIQDKIADKQGKQRRPVTAKPPDNEEEESEEEEEQEEEEEDPDKEIKELINKRLTTFMLLALSFEDEKNNEEFYRKLAESEKFDEVVSPLNVKEKQEINEFLKGKKKEAKKRVDKFKKKSK